MSKKIDEQNAAALKAAGYDVKKSMAGDESKVEYYDVVEDLNTTDSERMPTRRVLGDISVLKPKVEFMPPTTRVFETVGDFVVPRDSFLHPNLGESQKPTQQYLCENPEHQKLHRENFLAPGESEGVTPADYVPSKPAVLKRAAGLFSNIINLQGGDGVDSADRFTGGK